MHKTEILRVHEVPKVFSLENTLLYSQVLEEFVVDLYFGFRHVQGKTMSDTDFSWKVKLYTTEQNQRNDETAFVQGMPDTHDS